MARLEKRDEAVRPIPPFRTLEEEAEFWDSHSALEQVDEGTMIGFHSARDTSALTIRLEPDDIRRIREEADQRGIAPAALARTWILERLRGQSR